MGVHGKTLVRKSPNSSSSPINRKKISSEKASNIKATNQKSSTVAGIRSNASAGVDANMAPALTEPLSPTEKLSNTSANIATTTVSNEEETKLESSNLVETSNRSAPVVNANIREKRNSQRNIALSTRVTRSRDLTATQERPNTPTVIKRESPTATTVTTTATTIGTRKSKRNSKESDNEQMGISAATPSTTSSSSNAKKETDADLDNNIQNDKTTNSSNNNNNNNIVCKDSSTAQLLADLTTDFAETITAEICLRKQLPEVKVSTPETAQLSASETDSEITATNSASRETPGLTETKSETHMESTAENDGDKTIQTEEAKKAENTEVETKPKQTNTAESLDSEANNELSPTEVTVLSELPTTEPKTAIVDLPPINSDSTMTASEEETEELDALEAKLSQLDGTIAASDAEIVTDAVVDESDKTLITNSLEIESTIVATASATATTAAATTPPRTPSQQQTATTPTNQQLLLTPTSSTSQMLSLTPQSSSSLMRDVNATGTVATGGEIEDQELEEVLKALKGFEANAAGADGVLCDLNVFLNEVYTSFNCDDVAISATNHHQTQQQQSHPQHQHNQQQNLLNTTTGTSTAITKVVVSPLKELQLDIEKTQQNMHRKIDFILRRLRKIQVRYMSKHTTEEIAGLFELTARLTNKGSNNGNMQTAKDYLTTTVISARPPPLCWEDDIKNSISTAQMLSLLNRLETSANAQQLCTTTFSSSSPTYSAPTLSNAQQMRKSKKLADASANVSASSTTTTSCTTIPADVDRQQKGEIVSTLSTQIIDELSHVSGMLRAELRDVQLAYDSDATESSSGEESADEMVAYNNQVQQSLSIVKRAAWRYSRERAAIASRWSWLLSQIADLEIKIRQHSELYQEVVRTKGSVLCEEELSKSGTKRETTINAYGDSETAALSDASRTRGYVPTHFRKRKILQTTNLHTFSKKAARPSTIKCGCQWPINPCALCTGRPDPTAPRDLPDTMMLPERVALLDPGYHPVLSFSENVNNSIHFEAIARTPSWQHRIVRIQPKSVVRSVWKAEREAANSSGHHSSRKYGDILMPTQKRRYVKKKDRLASVINNSTNFQTRSGSGDASSTGTGVTGIETSTGNGMTSLKQMAHNSTKKIQCPSMRDGILLEPQSPISSNQAIDCQTPPNYDQYNPNQTHSSLIFNNQQLQQYNSSSNNKRKVYKHRKSLIYHNNPQYHNINNNNNNTNSNYSQQQHNNSNNSSINNSQNQQNYTNGDIYNTDYVDFGGVRSRTASPTHGIGSSNYHKYERSVERRNRISYDIDNIVIPYSVAAATRVEILPYKEIPTPKWRVFDDETFCDSEESIETINAENTSEKSMTENEVTTTTAHDIEDVEKFENQTNHIQKIKLIETSETTKPTITTTSEPATMETEKEKETLVENTVSPVKSPTVQKLNDEGAFLKPIENNVEAKTSVQPLLTSNKAKDCDNSTKDKCTNNDEDAPLTKKPKIETEISTQSSSSSNFSPTTADPQADHQENDIGCARGDEDSDKHKTFSIYENSNCNSDKEIILITDLDEDISDEIFNLRHERALHEERRKFQTYLKFPWSTRSRANRRIDSRAESSGANTPDPASPAPQSLGGGDQESIPSPLAPSTPLTPLEVINETASESATASATSITSVNSSSTIAPPAFPTNVATILNNFSNSSSGKRNERRRTTSAKNAHIERSERRSLTPDSRELPFAIPPFEPLKFPLSDDTFEKLSSVTYLPPSVSTFLSEDFKHQDDYQQYNRSGGMTTAAGFAGSSSVYFKTVVTARNGKRSNSTSKGACDFNGRRRGYRRNQSIVDAEHKVADNNDETKTLPYINGQVNFAAGSGSNVGNVGGTIITANSTDVDDDIDDDDDVGAYYDDLDENDDDGYPKHPLAPGSDIDNLIDDDYNPYATGGNSNSLLGVSDSESEADPFEDDDPNDPEWKGEPSNRSERHSERLRKRS